MEGSSTMRKIILVTAAAAAMGGCVSMGDLSREKPIYSGELTGNYLDLAECTKNQHARVAPYARVDLLHDKVKKEATVTWSHDFGTMNAFVFHELDQSHTTLTAYSAVSDKTALIKYAEECQPARAASK